MQQQRNLAPNVSRNILLSKGLKHGKGIQVFNTNWQEKTVIKINLRKCITNFKKSRLVPNTYFTCKNTIRIIWTHEKRYYSFYVHSCLYKDRYQNILYKIRCFLQNDCLLLERYQTSLFSSITIVSIRRFS